MTVEHTAIAAQAIILLALLAAACFVPEVRVACGMTFGLGVGFFFVRWGRQL